MNRSAPTKRQAISPKLHVLRQVAAKVAPTFKRALAEAGRVAINPSAAHKFAADAETTLAGLMAAELAKTGLPLATEHTPWPPAPKTPKEGEEAKPVTQFWAYQALSGQRNFMYGRSPVACAFGHFKVTETGCHLSTGGVYFPFDDVLVALEAGSGGSHTGGTNATGRLRVGGRKDVADSLVHVPWSSADVTSLKLLDKLAPHTVHTRKSGHALADVADVASGRADAAILTRLHALELHLAHLLMVEAGGVLLDLTTGKPATLHGATPTTQAVAANPALAAALVKVLG